MEKEKEKLIKHLWLALSDPSSPISPTPHHILALAIP
jgi:hypothetical protein